MKGYRTLIFFGVALTPPLLNLILQVLELSQWRQLIPADYWALYSLLVSAFGIWLRYITDTPVGGKK